MFAPRYHPSDDSFVFLPPPVSINATSKQNDNMNKQTNMTTEKTTIIPPSQPPRRSTYGFGSRNSKIKRDKIDKNNYWAPRSYHCKIVDIRSKQTGTAIARLGGSRNNRDSSGELRRRLIEFTIETRSKEIVSSNNLNPSHDGEDPAITMASGFHQMGLGNANGNQNHNNNNTQNNNQNNESNQSILAGKVIRRQSDCETFRSQVLGGGVLPLDDVTRNTCREIFQDAASSSENNTNTSNTGSNDADNTVGTNSENLNDTSMIQPTGNRRRYRGFSANTGTDLDLSVEVSLCGQLEGVLNFLLTAAANKGHPPHIIISDFLGISASVAASTKSTQSSSSSTTTSSTSSSRGSNRRKTLIVDVPPSVMHEHTSNVSGGGIPGEESGSEMSGSGEEDRGSQTSKKKSSNHDSTSTSSLLHSNNSSSNSLNNVSSTSNSGHSNQASLMPKGVDIPLPPKSEWPDYPILVRCSEDVDMKIGFNNVSAYGALPINDELHPIPFETNLFKGIAMIRIADLSTSPIDYFKGKRRKMQVCVQGKFKKPLRYDQVFGGQEFNGGLRNIPGKWLIKWAFELLKPRLPKSFESDLFGQKPYFLSPLVLTAQKMRADRGEPQAVTDFEIEEEMGLILGEQYIGKNDDKGRKKTFGGAGALANTYFDTDLVYTFDYFQQFLRSDQFALDLGVKLLDLSHYLGEQPLLLTMAKDLESGEYLWKFELWHERCVPLDTSRNGKA
mmetsp:Transcript_4835/g.6229  ORF Transcript_4835/g.6229 Transcript_4835/m.6229 type:complete len:728 (-) Transcript_4835:265-2448(-)